MAEEQTRAEIEQSIAETKAAIEQIREDMAQYAYGLQGHFIEQPLGHHPVWGDEWYQLLQAERRHGIETGPLIAPYETDERWAKIERWETEVFAQKIDESYQAMSYADVEARAVEAAAWTEESAEALLMPPAWGEWANEKPDPTLEQAYAEQTARLDRLAQMRQALGAAAERTLKPQAGEETRLRYGH